MGLGKTTKPDVLLISKCSLITGKHFWTFAFSKGTEKTPPLPSFLGGLL